MRITIGVRDRPIESERRRRERGRRREEERRGKGEVEDEGFMRRKVKARTSQVKSSQVEDGASREKRRSDKTRRQDGRERRW